MNLVHVSQYEQYKKFILPIYKVTNNNDSRAMNDKCKRMGGDEVYIMLNSEVVLSLHFRASN